uniref:Uncharacterized protein n=1 Tax=Rhizophora mucronata TaxID=61149 RepID=A0A2P2Q8F8_RHIMU
MVYQLYHFMPLFVRSQNMATPKSLTLIQFCSLFEVSQNIISSALSSF